MSENIVIKKVFKNIPKKNRLELLIVPNIIISYM